MSCAMVFVSGPLSFYIYRFLLGAAEAGFLPSIVYYLGSWYTNEQRAAGLGVLFIASATAGMLGGPIAAVLLQIHAFAISGWHWIFIIEGGVTVLIGIAFSLLMPCAPSDAGWLPEANRA